MAAETQFTANTGMVAISTANSNLDGTGTLGTVLTAASNGTKVKSVTIKAQTNTTQGMVRLFVTDGGGTRLIAEVEVPAVTKSATDSSFERYLPLDLDLLSGDVLKASTQNSETFNIIAEGLNWAYLSTVRPESVTYTANTGTNLISTANSNLDGTGTVVTILTAGTSANGWNGCRIKSIVVKGIVNTTAGMVRLFVQDSAGSNTKLLAEVEVPAVTKSATARSFVQQIDFGGGLGTQAGGLNIQAGYKIIASTQNSESFIVTAEGLDWKYPASGPIYVKNFTPASGTSTTSEELLHSLQVAAGSGVVAGTMLEVFSSIVQNSSAGTKTYRMYISPTASLGDGSKVLIATSNAITTSNVASPFSRFLPVISDTAVECIPTTSAILSQYNAAASGSSANVTVPSLSAGFYILISGQKSTAGDTDTVRWSMVRITN